MTSPYSQGRRLSKITRSRRALTRKNRFGGQRIESLEPRTLLSYTFALVGQTATVSPVAATGGPILIDEVAIAGNPFLEWSQDNGVTFSADWDDATPGTQTLPATTASTIDLTPTTGAGSSITLGDLVSPASNIFAHFNLGPPFGAANNSLTIDDRTSTHAAGSYDFFGVLGTITGPGGAAGGIDFTSFGPINSYLVEGGPADNTFNIHSTFNATIASTTIVGGAGDDTANVLGDTFPDIGTPLTINLGGGTNIVNVGNGDAGATISSPVVVTDPTTLNIDDTADTTHSTATLDNLSGNVNAPFEVTGLGAPIEYGTGVTALNVSGGTFGATGVTYNINNTQAGTTTTINGGPNDDTFNLSATANNLSDLAGPVVINGNGGTNSSELFDQNGAGGSYAIDGTTVAAPGFAGLTYGTITNLTLDSANNASTIDVNDTAAGVTTAINTGIGGSTVNVLATDATGPLDIVGSGVDTVNIGSTGGPGSMAVIQGPISVTNPSSRTDLIFHDENDVTGQTWTLDNDDGVPTGSVAVTGSATTSYNPLDLSSLTVNAGSGGNTFNVNGTSAFYATTLNTGTGADTTNVFATGGNTLDIHGQDGTDMVTLGASAAAPLGMQGLNGTINVDNTTGFTNLVLDDSEDTTGQTALLFNDGTNGQVTGLAPATINYSDGDGGVSSLTVFGGSGGNTFTVDGTLNNPGVIPAGTDLFTGTGDDTTFVEATSANGPLFVHGQSGQDAVIIGLFGSLADILGPVTIDNDNGFTDLTLDASADLVSHDLTLKSAGPLSTIPAGLAPSPITYTTGDISSLTIDTSAFGTQVLNIDMSGGNPIPSVGSPGLIFNAGADFGTAGNGTHAINIFGELPTGPFASETHNANDPNVFPQVGQYGSISFDDGQGTPASHTSLNYTGLLPITDTTPAVAYTFNDFADDQSFSATTGPIVGGFQTLEFANTPTTPPPTFETTDIANKNFVTFNTPNIHAGAGLNGVVDVPIPSDGLLSLTFNTPTGGDNNVAFVNTPPGVVTSLNGGSDEDVTSVTGLGVAAGTVLFLNGGPATNTLDYDAGGETPTVTPGLLPGEVLITIPGAGIVDAINYQQINITDVAPLVITPGPAVAINSVEGFQLVNAVVGTFTVPVPVLLPSGGFPAGDFTASLDWGDPSPDPAAGTITQDASNPSVYYITGTHTFLENGTFTVDNSVAFAGGTITSPVNGTSVSITFGPAGPTAGTPATASVTQGPLAVSAFPIVGTEGAAIPAAPIATFIDAGGADPIGNYSATITVTSSTGVVVVSVPAASITQNGNSSQYTVNAPAFTLLEEGTYQVLVTVTDSGGATPITVEGASTAVIADAALAAGAATLLAPNTGVALPAATVVGTFTDFNSFATTADFTATIDWGDGSPASTGVVVATATPGVFDIEGGHTYAKPGVFTTLITVLDVGGSSVVITGSATVTDLPVTGSTSSFTAVEGQSTGLFVLATYEDPNTLATVANEHAELAIGGWGDGTPTVAGVALTVQQTGVDPATGDPTFEVLGSHTYAEETPAGLPDTLSVIITTLGGATTTLTSPPGGGVTVVDAPLTNPVIAAISGVEGSSTGTVVLGSFTDTNQAATVADFTSGGGSVIVNWGDGSAPETLAAANLAAVGSANGVIFTISDAHTYAEEGPYQITISVLDDGGAATSISSSAAITDAALTAGPAVLLTPSTGVALPSSTVIGNFTDANTAAPASDFTASIDWGDGSPISTGTVISTGAGGFEVEGGHTYTKPGVFTTTITVLDDGGSRVVITGSATVGDLATTGAVQSFTATEGKNTGTIVLGTFTDPNPLATASDVTATLPVGGWGDGTPAAPVTLAVQLIGASPSGAVFQILGSHTYAEEGSFTVNINVTTLGGVTTALTAGTATVVDAPLASSNGTIITGIEGTTTGPVLLGSFTDANQGATVADFTAGGGSVVVNWGDGSAPDTLAASNLAATGTANGVVFTITAAHTYAEEGTHAYTITVTDAGGSTTIISGHAVIADAALSAAATQPTVSTTEADLFPVPVFAPPVFTGAVASFTDANLGATVADFTATIDWGDGTPMTAGTVSAGAGAATFTVSGSHTYADSGVNGGTGTFAIQVFVVDTGGSRLTVANTASVADNPLAITGRLNPQSDSGVSNLDAITNVRQPDFFGTSEPLSQVVLFASPLAGGPAIPIGQVVAGSSGIWNIMSSVALPDGHYEITAMAVDQFGETRGGTTVITPDLLIDTTGPRITGLFFNRLNGQVDYTIQDPNPASGVNVASLLNSSNYEFTSDRVSKNNLVSRFLVTNVSVRPDSLLPNALDVAVTFDSGAVIRGGFDVFRIRGTTAGTSSVRDLAGNDLDGDFYGTFPSGDGISGDFVAELEAIHNEVFAPQTVVGTASAGNGGVGGPIHRPLFVAVLRRGASPIFSTLIGGSASQSATASHHGKKAAVTQHAKPTEAQSHHAKPAVHKTAKAAVSHNHPKGPLGR